MGISLSPRGSTGAVVISLVMTGSGCDTQKFFLPFQKNSPFLRQQRGHLSSFEKLVSVVIYGIASWLVSTDQSCSVGAFSQAHKYMKERLSLLSLQDGHSIKWTKVSLGSVKIV